MAEISTVLNENSMLFWWPAIQDLGIPVPKTILVPMDADLKKAAREIGYPLFLRTDLCSGKHDWQETCFVASEDHLLANAERVKNANERWGMLGIQFQAFALREFLDLETAFTAFSGKMPINKERRYFIRDGEVCCHHPYWPKDAFNQHPARMADDPEWESKLQILNDESDEGVLTEYAQRVSRALSGYWSVDFAKAKNGQWYLLDMALGHNSYHWPDCDAR